MNPAAGKEYAANASLTIGACRNFRPACSRMMWNEPMIVPFGDLSKYIKIVFRPSDSNKKEPQTDLYLRTSALTPIRVLFRNRYSAL